MSATNGLQQYLHRLQYCVNVSFLECTMITFSFKWIFVNFFLPKSELRHSLIRIRPWMNHDNYFNDNMVVLSQLKYLCFVICQTILLNSSQYVYTAWLLVTTKCSCWDFHDLLYVVVTLFTKHRAQYFFRHQIIDNKYHSTYRIVSYVSRYISYRATGVSSQP